jgi:hypothetical protein
MCFVSVPLCCSLLPKLLDTMSPKGAFREPPAPFVRQSERHCWLLLSILSYKLLLREPKAHHEAVEEKKSSKPHASHMHNDGVGVHALSIPTRLGYFQHSPTPASQSHMLTYHHRSRFGAPIFGHRCGNHRPQTSKHGDAQGPLDKPLRVSDDIDSVVYYEVFRIPKLLRIVRRERKASCLCLRTGNAVVYDTMTSTAHSRYEPLQSLQVPHTLPWLWTLLGNVEAPALHAFSLVRPTRTSEGRSLNSGLQRTTT